MNKIALLNGDGFENVRYISIYNEETGYESWFVAKDVAKALGYLKLEKMYELVNEEDKLEIDPQKLDKEKYVSYLHIYNNENIVNTGSLSTGGTQNEKYVKEFEPNENIHRMVLINEYALYKIAASSKAKNAEPFQRWLFREVIPSIRKNGYYVTDEMKKEIEQKRQSIDELILHARREKLIRLGVKFPSCFSTLDYYEWIGKINSALDRICRRCKMKDIDDTFDEIASLIYQYERISLKRAKSEFIDRQLEKIRKVGYSSIDEDYKDLSNITYYHVIYDNKKLKNIFDDYIIKERYLAMRDLGGNSSVRTKTIYGI